MKGTHVVIGLFVSFTLLQGCSSDATTHERGSLPQGVMTADSMALVLADIQVLEAAIRSREVRKMKLQDEARIAYLSYFDSTTVNKERFLKSLDHWKHNFEGMENINDQAMEILSTRLAQEEKKTDEKDE